MLMSFAKTALLMYDVIKNDQIEATFGSIVIAKRSFSRLKIIKSDRRATMVDERLSFLAVMAMKDDIVSSMDTSEIIRDINLC
jgi:hypothetical protein